MIESEEKIRLIATIKEGVVESVTTHATFSVGIIRGDIHTTSTPAESLWKAYFLRSIVTPKKGDRVLLGFMDLEGKSNPYVIGVFDERDTDLVVSDRIRIPEGSFYYKGANSSIIGNGLAPYVGLFAGTSKFELDAKTLTMIVNDATVGKFAKDFLLLSNQPNDRGESSYFSMRNSEVEMSSRGKMSFNSNGLQFFYGNAYIGDYNGGQYKLNTGNAFFYHKKHVLSSSSFTHRIISRKSELAGAGTVSALASITTPTYSVSVAEGAMDFGTTEGSIKHTVLTPGNPLTVIRSDMGFQGLVGRFEINGIGEALLRATKDITLRTPSTPSATPPTSQLKMNALGQITMESILQQTFRLPPAPTPGTPATAIIDMLAVGLINIAGATRVNLQVPPGSPTATSQLELLPGVARLNAGALSGKIITPSLSQSYSPVHITSKTQTPGAIEPIPKGLTLYGVLQAMALTFDTHIHIGILGPVSPPLAPMSPSLAPLISQLLLSTNYTE